MYVFRLFQFRSPDRDQETDKRRIGLVRKAVRSAVTDAEAEGHLEKLISLPIADCPGVNVYESEREQTGIIRRQSCGARSVAAIFRGALNFNADAHRALRRDADRR